MSENVGNISWAAGAAACVPRAHRQLGVQTALQCDDNMHVRFLIDCVSQAVCWQPNWLHPYKGYSRGKCFSLFIEVVTVNSSLKFSFWYVCITATLWLGGISIFHILVNFYINNCNFSWMLLDCKSSRTKYIILS